MRQLRRRTRADGRLRVARREQAGALPVCIPPSMQHDLGWIGVSDGGEGLDGQSGKTEGKSNPGIITVSAETMRGTSGVCMLHGICFLFWVSLLGGKYEQRLWQPDGFTLQKIVFPHAAGQSHQAIRRHFDDILRLRNRCFHHEGIWYRPTLQQEHTDIHEAIGWVSPALQTAILSVDNFGTIYNGKGLVEADLRQRFGLT